MLVQFDYDVVINLDNVTYFNIVRDSNCYEIRVNYTDGESFEFYPSDLEEICSLRLYMYMIYMDRNKNRFFIQLGDELDCWFKENIEKKFRTELKLLDLHDDDRLKLEKKYRKIIDDYFQKKKGYL